jgi:hypothetical protein
MEFQKMLLPTIVKVHDLIQKNIKEEIKNTP